MSTNFRIKQVYASDNMITQIEGIKKFKFLDTLMLSNNKIRDLDNFLKFLTKFAFLDTVDLLGNPLAEEPDYRLKIIYEMPQIKILDRHPITVDERLKAQKMDPLWEMKQKRASPKKEEKK
jgi:hypothetical protein